MRMQLLIMLKNRNLWTFWKVLLRRIFRIRKRRVLFSIWGDMLRY